LRKTLIAAIQDYSMADKKTDFKEPEHWTVKGLLEYFMSIHQKMEDRSFAFVLGSGASRASGIPTGGELVETWLEELRLRHDPHHASGTLEAWATANNLGIRDFDYAHKAEFYPQVFERRFRNDPEEGFAFLEAAMVGKEPSFGYSVLARILEETRHKVVITTNFDNLVADALSIYTRSYPLVCGHESLAGFVRTHLRRPLVAKIHRDLLFGPINDGHGTNHLADGWTKALTNQFSFHTPIVLGYGGNDGSLMGLLENMEHGAIPGGIFWCYRLADGIPSERIRRLVSRHPGALIPVVGFDEFLLQLNNALSFDLLAKAVEQRAQQRAKHYREQVEVIQRRLETPTGDSTAQEADSEVKQALAATIERQKDWWAWQLKVREATDPHEQEKIYRAGLEQFPNSSELNGNFAIFMQNVHKDYDEAERLYRRVLELDPNRANTTGNFASFHLSQNHIPEAKNLAIRAWQLNASQPNQVAAEIALYRGLIAKFEHRDDALALGRLKSLLTIGFKRLSWSFDSVIAIAKKRLDEADYRLYDVLATAILDEGKATELDEFPEWHGIEPIPLDSPWEE
jgi:Tfp pilus assembly protein PilF